jgi:hypothetical protein
MPIILATQEAEIGGLRFEAAREEKKSETLSQKYPTQKKVWSDSKQYSTCLASMKP